MAYNYEFPYTDATRYNDDWLLKKMKELAARLDDLEDWRRDFTEAYEELLRIIAEIESGNFPESIRNAFRRWMEENALDLVGELVKMVFFGLDENGYFVAYIPEGWDDILFNTTGLDIAIAGVDFGHLTLSFEIGG